MSNHIVVEGPDGSGKSTALKILEQQLGVKAKHGGGPPKTERELRTRLNIDKDTVLLDRWTPISEQVYGIVLRGEYMIPREEFMWYIMEYHPQIIYCRPPRFILEQNLFALERVKPHKSIKHCESVRDNYWKIVDMYDSLMNSLIHAGLIVTIYDYTGKTL